MEIALVFSELGFAIFHVATISFGWCFHAPLFSEKTSHGKLRTKERCLTISETSAILGYSTPTPFPSHDRLVSWKSTFAQNEWVMILDSTDQAANSEPFQFGSGEIFSVEKTPPGSPKNWPIIVLRFGAFVWLGYVRIHPPFFFCRHGVGPAMHVSKVPTITILPSLQRNLGQFQLLGAPR